MVSPIRLDGEGPGLPSATVRGRSVESMRVVRGAERWRRSVGARSWQPGLLPAYGAQFVHGHETLKMWLIASAADALESEQLQQASDAVGWRAQRQLRSSLLKGLSPS